MNKILSFFMIILLMFTKNHNFLRYETSTKYCPPEYVVLNVMLKDLASTKNVNCSSVQKTKDTFWSFGITQIPENEQSEFIKILIKAYREDSDFGNILNCESIYSKYTLKAYKKVPIPQPTNKEISDNYAAKGNVYQKVYTPPVIVTEIFKEKTTTQSPNDIYYEWTRNLSDLASNYKAIVDIKAETPFDYIYQFFSNLFIYIYNLVFIIIDFILNYLFSFI